MADSGPVDVFSSNAEAVITRPLDLIEQERRTGSQVREDGVGIQEHYEIERTVREIGSHQLKRIALQFPDEMLRDSVAVYQALNSRLKMTGHDDVQLFVLADTSYGSCCVDEVAAQHVRADAVVHYGHACLSPTTRLPTIYVYGYRAINVEIVVASFATAYAESPRLIHLHMDVAYCHAGDALVNSLRHRYPEAAIAFSKPPTFLPPQSDYRKQDRLTSKSAESEVILYIGPETLGLINLMVTHSQLQLYRHDPATGICGLESGRTNKLLMRRYTMVQKARDADVFGILVGTLGVASYLHLIKELRNILNGKGKKTYTISVGKLNPAKLANFMEIECFVLVACPENSLIESKEFLRPIVTPFELQIALGVVAEWNGRYLLNFDQVLQEARTEDVRNDHESDDEPEFSLVTGKYRRVKRYDEVNPSRLDKQPEGAIVSRNHEQTMVKALVSAAGDFMSERTWRGLEQNIGQDEPGLLEQGRSGIAKGYKEVDHPHEES